MSTPSTSAIVPNFFPIRIARPQFGSQNNVEGISFEPVTGWHLSSCGSATMQKPIGLSPLDTSEALYALFTHENEWILPDGTRGCDRDELVTIWQTEVIERRRQYEVH